MESRGASLEELMTVIAGKIGKACYESGDVEGGMFPVGPAVGLITQIKSVREIMDEIYGRGRGCPRPSERSLRELKGGSYPYGMLDGIRVLDFTTNAAAPAPRP
jgi:hypothetical protein